MGSDTLRRHAAMAAAIELGKQSAAQALVVKAVTRLVPELSETANELYSEVRDLRDLVSAASGKELTGALVHPLARKFGLDQLVAEEIERKRVRWMGEQLVELPVRGRSLTNEVVARTRYALWDAHGGDLDKSVQAALGWTQGSIPNLDTLLMPGQALPETIVAFWQHGRVNVNPHAFLEDAKGLVDIAERTVMGVVTPATGYVENLETLVSGMKADWTIEGLTSDSKALANVLSTTLALGGFEEQAQGVIQAAGYIEKAAQVQDAVALLASASTGWGAAVAFMGFANAGLNLGGGLGFGGAGSKPDSNAEVLAAIAALAQRIDRQFERVNAKLKEISDDIAKVMQQLADQKLLILAMTERLERVEEKVDVLLTRGEVQFRITLETINRIEESRCKGWMDSRKTIPPLEVLNGCLRFYGDAMAARTAEDTLTTVDAEKETNALLELSTKFGFEAKSADMWQQAGTLGRVLERYTPGVPGPAVHWPTLAIAMEQASLLVLHAPERFEQDSVDTRARLIAPLEESFQRHKDFVGFLRGQSFVTSKSQLPRTPEAHPVLGPLMKAYRDASTAFQMAWTTLLGTAAKDDIIKQMSEGRRLLGGVQLTDVSPPPLVNPGRSPTTTWDMFYGGHRPFWDNLPVYAKVYIPLEIDTPGSAELVIPELVALVKRAYSQQSGREQYEQTAFFLMKLSFYGHEVDRTPDAAPLIAPLRFEGSHQAPYDSANQQAPISDLVEYISWADGKTNNQPAGHHVFAQWVAVSFVNLASEYKKIALERITANPRLLYGYLSEKIVEDKTKPWELLRPVKDALATLETLSLVVRAVLRLGYEELYRHMDVLISLFDGGLDTRLPSKALLSDWSEAISTTFLPNGQPREEDPALRLFFDTSKKVPARDCLRQLEDIVESRTKALEKSVALLLEAQHCRGKPFDDARIEGLFQAAFGDTLALGY